MNKIEIPLTNILKIIGLLVLVWILYQVREVILLLFVVFIFITALEPIVSWAEKNKIPRIATVSALYILIFGLLSLTIYLIIPPLVQEIISFTNNIINYPYLEKIHSGYLNSVYQFVLTHQSEWQSWVNSIYSQLSKISGGILNATVVIFGGISSAIMVLVLSFYTLVDKKTINEFLLSFVPNREKSGLVTIIQKVGLKLGQWLRGQVVISFLMGLILFLILYFADVPYALTIGIIAALLEVIPIVGFIITGLIALLVTLMFTNWITALIVLILYIVVQQLETHILVPKIMSKAVGVPPLIIIIALMIGSALGGMSGAVLSIPITAALVVTIRELQMNK